MVILDEHGSGKTMQLPQYLCDADFASNDKLIAVVEPRYSIFLIHIYTFPIFNPAQFYYNFCIRRENYNSDSFIFHPKFKFSLKIFFSISTDTNTILHRIRKN